LTVGWRRSTFGRANLFLIGVQLRWNALRAVRHNAVERLRGGIVRPRVGDELVVLVSANLAFSAR
jgi:hypothetical protein